MIGDYDSASFSTPGEGRFRPLEGATPTIGEVGALEVVAEVRIECVLARAARPRVVAALLAAHPYEEPAYDVVELADPGTAPTGSGRIGTVEETTLGGFARQVASALPPTAHGVRVAGDPTRVVRRVAVCGGAGDFLLDAVRRTDADVYVTSDLRHHPASEFLEQGGPALVDVAHWAAEWTWLPVVARRVTEAMGDTVETRVSTLCTDPWNPRRPHRRRALKADPAAQLALLDLQELDARADLLRHQRETLPELAEIATLTASPCGARRQAAGRTDPGRRPDRRAGEGRRRRRAGQGPAQARPGADGPGADHQPQGPRADAGRARVAAAADHLASRTTSSR